MNFQAEWIILEFSMTSYATPMSPVKDAIFEISIP